MHFFTICLISVVFHDPLDVGSDIIAYQQDGQYQTQDNALVSRPTSCSSHLSNRVTGMTPEVPTSVPRIHDWSNSNSLMRTFAAARASSTGENSRSRF